MVKMIRSVKNIFSKMKIFKSFALAAFVLPFLANAVLAADATPDQAKKSLVVYFSESGNTKRVAEAIHKKVGGDILEIRTVKPYPKDYDTLVNYAKDEQQKGIKPELSSQIPNLEEYEIIYLGFPNWWSSLPMPIHTFAEKSKLDGKQVAPFLTHGGGGTGHIPSDLKKLLPHSQIAKPLSVHGTRSGNVEGEVDTWVKGLAAEFK